MPYRLSAQADREIDQLYSFGVGQFGERQADRYLDGLIDAFERLADLPRIGKAIGDGFRVSFYRTHVIIYIVHPGDAVEIARVVDARTNWQESLS